jgi:hypothetical protein
VPDTATQTRKRRRRPPASEITPETPIWCPACQREHPASAFNREKRRFSGLSGICREAQAQARKTPKAQAATRRFNQKRWANPEYRAKALEHQRRRRRERGATVELRRARRRLQRIVDEWKQQGCLDCGYSDIRAIDPDHRPGEIKVGNVSRMVTLCASAARIRAELAKCEPRCVRCHRKATMAARPNSWRARTKLPPSWRERLARQDFNDQLKLALGCADCGWAEWARGLDWDHARGEKEHEISALVNNRAPIELLIRETSKCDVVCANCHRIRTCRRRIAAHAKPAGKPLPARA